MSFATAPQEPAVLTAGDAAAWRRADLRAAYSGPEYSLAYVLRGPAGAAVVVPADSDFRVALTSAQTLAWAPGRWHWQARVTRAPGGDQVTAAQGWLEVRPRLDALAPNADLRSYAQRVLEAIDAALLGVVTAQHRSVTLADGRAVVSLSPAELQQLRGHYAAIVAAEEAAAGMRPRRNRIWARL